MSGTTPDTIARARPVALNAHSRPPLRGYMEGVGGDTGPDFAMRKAVVVNLPNTASMIGLASQQKLLMNCGALLGGSLKSPEGVVATTIDLNEPVQFSGEPCPIGLEIYLRGELIGWAQYVPTSNPWTPPRIYLLRPVRMAEDWEDLVFRYGPVDAA